MSVNLRDLEFTKASLVPFDGGPAIMEWTKSPIKAYDDEDDDEDDDFDDEDDDE